MLNPHERCFTITKREEKRWRLPDSSVRVKVVFLMAPTISNVDPAAAILTVGLHKVDNRSSRFELQQQKI